MTNNEKCNAGRLLPLDHEKIGTDAADLCYFVSTFALLWSCCLSLFTRCACISGQRLFAERCKFFNEHASKWQYQFIR